MILDVLFFILVGAAGVITTFNKESILLSKIIGVFLTVKSIAYLINLFLENLY